MNETCEGTELELVGLLGQIQALNKELAESRSKLKEKQVYLFGPTPEKPEGGKLCGNPLGIVANLRSSVSNCILISGEIREIIAAIERA